MNRSATLTYRDYSVGWICALPTEMAAAQGMLDEQHNCQRKNIFPTGLGASPCTKPIRDSSESSSQAEPFITNRPCSPSTPNVHCHRVHSISYLRQQMQRCISFPIP